MIRPKASRFRPRLEWIVRKQSHTNEGPLMRTAQPKTMVMIAESAAMSKPRMEQVGIGRGGWPAGNARASDAPQKRFLATS